MYSNIQILKHEWPVRCFIPSLVAVAKTSETICENSMAILKVSQLFYSYSFNLVVEYATKVVCCLSASKWRGFWFLKGEDDSTGDHRSEQVIVGWVYCEVVL